MEQLRNHADPRLIVGCIFCGGPEETRATTHRPGSSSMRPSPRTCRSPRRVWPATGICPSTSSTWRASWSAPGRGRPIPRWSAATSSGARCGAAQDPGASRGGMHGERRRRGVRTRGSATETGRRQARAVPRRLRVRDAHAARTRRLGLAGPAQMSVSVLRTRQARLSRSCDRSPSGRRASWRVEISGRSGSEAGSAAA